MSNECIVSQSLVVIRVCLHYHNLSMENQGFVLPEFEGPLIQLPSPTGMQILLKNFFI